MDTAIYLFALARTGRLPPLQVAGLDDNVPVVTADMAGVTAILSEVALADFSGPAADAHLTDLNWVGPRVVRHGEIMREAMRYAPVLPLRFGTLFSGRESLARAIGLNRTGIIEFLERIEGREEWAVKIYFSRKKARERLFSERVAASRAVFESMSQGMRYVKERQLLAEVDKDVGTCLKSVLSKVAAPLVESASDWCKREIRLDNVKEAEATLVANWAFLIDCDAAEGFASTILRMDAEYHAKGLAFHVSGPWPPYSFTPQLQMEAQS